MNIKKILLNEKAFFCLIVLLNAIPVLSLKFFLTLDGPAHLYNGNIIKDLIVGNSPLINSLYEFNPVITPNWSGHFILAVLSLVFNGFITEKIFILLYLIFLPVSFRYLTNAISPSSRNLSYLIFPFSYAFLFECGFFNFCIAFIFMFFTLGYWYKNSEKPKIYHVIILCLLLTVTFFSHILIYGFLGAVLLLLMIGSCIRDFKGLKVFAGCILEKSLILFIAALPSLILLIQFLISIKFESTYEKYPFDVLLKWIIKVRPLILFNFEKESLITIFFIFIYLSALLYTVIIRVKSIASRQLHGGHFLFSLKQGIVVSDVILLFSFFLLTLFFIIPNSASAGMMSDRLCVGFFIFLIIWLAIQPYRKWFSYIIIVSTLVLHFSILITHYPSYKGLSNIANEIYKTSEYVKDESIVVSVNLTDNWMLGHSADYMGADKAIVLYNYEAFYKWFPLRWNKDNIPDLLIGDRQTIKSIWWYSNPNSAIKRKVDYVMLFGSTGLLYEPNMQELKYVLYENYNLIYKSSDSYILLFELKNDS